MGTKGVLSFIKLSEEERHYLLRYLTKVKKTQVFDIIEYLFDDDFLKFIDVFSGESIKVPRREEVLKIVNYIKIYTYCQARGFSDESIEAASKIFKRRQVSVRKVIDKVSTTLKELEDKEMLEDE